MNSCKTRFSSAYYDTSSVALRCCLSYGYSSGWGHILKVAKAFKHSKVYKFWKSIFSHTWPIILPINGRDGCQDCAEENCISDKLIRFWNISWGYEVSTKSLEYFGNHYLWSYLEMRCLIVLYTIAKLALSALQCYLICNHSQF